MPKHQIWANHICEVSCIPERALDTTVAFGTVLMHLLRRQHCCGTTLAACSKPAAISLHTRLVLTWVAAMT